MILTKSLIKADIIAAKQAIDYFDQYKVKDIKNIAAYHLQQSTEKLIKIQIYSSGININHSRLYTHNIEKLIIYGETLNIPMLIPEYIKKRSLQITDWEASSRYDVGFSIRIDVLKKTYNEVLEWHDQISAL